MKSKQIFTWSLALLLIVTFLSSFSIAGAEEKSEVAILTDAPAIKHLFQRIPVGDRPVNFEIYTISSRLIGETIACPEFDLSVYDLVLVDTSRPSLWVMETRIDPLRPFLESARQAGARIVFIDFIGPIVDEEGNELVDPLISGLTTISPADLPQVRMLRDYIENAIISGNLLNFLKFGYVHFLGGEAVYVSPGVMPLPGIYHPEFPALFFENTADYIAWAKGAGRFDPERPTIGILASPWRIRSGNIGTIDALIKEIERQGANVIAAYPYSIWRNPELWEFPLFHLEGERLIDAAITINTCIPLTPYRRELYYELGVQILSGLVTPGMTPEEWRDYDKGLPLAMTGWASPGIEFSGFISPTVIAGRIDELDVPLLEQVERIVARAINHARLVREPNKDKKIAVTYFDYGVARTCKVTRGLNKPQSIINLLKAMDEHNFNVDVITEDEFLKAREQHGKTIPMYAQPKLEAMVNNHREEIVLIPVSEYRRWLQEMIPAHRIEEVIEFWGEPEDGNMIVEYNGEPHLVLPMIKRGNVILLPEPGPCGGTVAEEIVFHEPKATPPHHHRIAFYLWLQREGIDAVVSLSIGTHVTLPGRERALGPDCWSFLLSGHIPIVRPFSTDMVAVAMRARRRGDMVISGYIQSPIVQAGQHGSIGALREAIFTYRETIEGPVRDAQRPHVIEQALEMNLDKDMRIPKFKGVPHDAALIDKIEHHLEEVRVVMISAGLHTLGETPEQTLLSETVMLMLGPAFIDEISKVGDIEEKREAQAKAKKLLLAVFNDRASEAAQIAILGNTSSVLADLLAQGRGHYQNFHASREIEAIIDVLSGRFVMPGPSGDQIHNPETLPTGRHLYAFDPRRFPTKGAWDVGRETLGQMLVEHKEGHGVYPDKLSFIVWASETMRHRGVVESQIIYALGVEPVWDERGRVRIDDDQGVAGGLRIIPDEELGRPRVDVTALITGTYRNTFPCRVKVIDAAVRLVAAHEEEGQINHIRQNYLALKDYLVSEQGMSNEIAHELAAARVFGPPLGELGARVGGIIKASLTDDRALLADLFLSQFAHIYSAKSWGVAHEDISRRALSGTDIALFSRSSPRGGLVSGTCSCPSAFLGGLSMAIEHLDGVPPQTMVTNLRDAFNPGIVTADEFLRTEVRTTLNNPRWIENMKAEGYSGAREMHHIVNHVWGWEGVTPHIITGDMWNDIYEVHVKDRYNLNMEEFFNEFHPHALQAIVARLLEVIKAGEWEADPAIIQELMERFIESVAKHGMTCLAAQCANPRLDQFLVEQVKEGRVRLDREIITQFDEQRVATLGVGLVGLEAALEAAEAMIEPLAELFREVVGEVMEVVHPEAPHFHLDLPVSKLIAAFILIALIGVGYLVITKKAKKQGSL